MKQPKKPRQVAGRVTPDRFAAVIRAYQQSDKFAALAPSSQSQYAYYLRIAARPDTLGSLAADEIRPSLVQAFLDGFGDRLAAQAAAKTALKAVERWAIVRDLLPAHGITIGTEAPGSEGGHEPWPDELIALAEQHARPHLARFITLAANTGQRGSDLVRMRWSDVEEYEGRIGLNVTQQKTGVRLWLPLTVELQTAMATWERRPTFIALDEDGRQMTRKKLSDQWTRERRQNAALAPIEKAGLVMHGLRATAVVRLRRAGATTSQICDMVGLSEGMVKRYSRFSVQRDNALAAVHLLERNGPRTTLKKRDVL